MKSLITRAILEIQKTRMMMDRQIVQKRLNRSRVLEFEREVEGKLVSLGRIESEMKEIGDQRRNWLDNISTTHNQGNDVYQKRIELVKVQAEMASLGLKLDSLRLEGHHESQRLAMLVEATRPLKPQETDEQRDFELTMKARRDTDVLRSAIQSSLDYRTQLGNVAYDLTLNLNRLQQQSELEQAQKAEDLKEHLTSYCDRMNESINRAQDNYSEIIKEYLVLRHNAQVVKEILARSQNDASFERQELQKKLDKMVNDAQEQRYKLDSMAQQEQRVRLGDLREEVIREETALAQLREEVRELRKERKGNVSELLQQIKTYEKKYHRLQVERAQVLREKRAQVAALRQEVEQLERQALLRPTPDDLPIVDEEGQMIALLEDMFKRSRLNSTS